MGCCFPKSSKTACGQLQGLAGLLTHLPASANASQRYEEAVTESAQLCSGSDVPSGSSRSGCLFIFKKDSTSIALASRTCSSILCNRCTSLGGALQRCNSECAHLASIGKGGNRCLSNLRLAAHPSVASASSSMLHSEPWLPLFFLPWQVRARGG